MSPRALIGTGLAACVLGLLVYFLFLSRPAVRQAIWMSPPLRPVVMQGFQNFTDSDEHAKYFFFLVRRHEYAPARSLMTPEAKASLSTLALSEEWAAFEKAHGRVTTWTLTGGNSHLLPTYVDKVYSVSGSRGSVGTATLDMTQIKGSWQIARLTVAN